MKKLVILSIALSLSMHASDKEQAVKQPTFSVTIPGWNIPLEFKRTENSGLSVPLLMATFQHGLLISKHFGSQKTVPEMLIDHAVLGASRIVIGSVATVCHELAHATFAPKTGSFDKLRKITINWSPDRLLNGSFSGVHLHSSAKPILEEDDTSDRKARSLTCIAHYNRLDDFYSKNIVNYASGPIVGAVTAYALYKGLTYLHPAAGSTYTTMVANVAENTLNLVPISTFMRRLIENVAIDIDEEEKEALLFAVVPVSGGDGDQMLAVWQERAKSKQDRLEFIESHIKTFPEDTTRDFSLRVVEG